MNLVPFLVITAVLIVMILPSYADSSNAKCTIGPNGSTLCAGMSQTIDIAKSNINTSNSYGANPDVIITQDCAQNDIKYGNYFNTCYQPSILYVEHGTIVTWLNNDTWQHTVTYGNPRSMFSQGYFFDSKAMDNGESFSYQFNQPGSYPYFDSFNWWETGLIIVK